MSSCFWQDLIATYNPMMMSTKECIQMFLDAGANPSIMDRYGLSPAHYAMGSYSSVALNSKCPVKGWPDTEPVNEVKWLVDECQSGWLAGQSLVR